MLCLTLRQLEYVTAVAREGSLSGAALALHVSQPALSVALAQVEVRLGQTLFVRRKGARLTLTPFGREFITKAEDLLARAGQLEDPAAIRRKLAGTLTLGCFEDLAPVYLAPLLRRLRVALPGVALRWRTADFETLAQAMLDGGVDLALTYDLGLDASFERSVVGQVIPQAFVAPGRPPDRDGSISLRELAEHPLILFEEGLSIRHVLGLFRRQNLTPRVAHRVRSLELMRSLAAHGEGVGISYTRPPAAQSYDGSALSVLPIVDPEAAEALILARGGIVPPTDFIAMAKDLIAEEMAALATVCWNGSHQP